MQAWCLYCSQLKGRRQAAQNDFDAHGVKINWWHGIHAKSFGVASTHASSLATNPGPEVCHPFEVGIFLGWWNLWQHLLLSDHPGPFLCFEDDVILCDDFSAKLAHAMKSLPDDWHFAYVGRTDHLFPVEYHNSEGPAVRLTTQLMGGFHAILIRKNALKTLLNCNMACRGGIDGQIIKTTLGKLNFFAFKPSLAEQGSYANPDHPRYVRGSYYPESADLEESGFIS